MTGNLAPLEKRWLKIYALVVVLLTSTPYLLGYAREGDEWRFSGFVFGVEDGNSYIAKMLSGANGAWTFRTPYTSLPQHGAPAFLPYLLVGKLTAGPGQHEQLVALYHLGRAAAGWLMIWWTYRFISYFTVEVRYRRLGTVLATLGGGLGAALLLFGADWPADMPLELYSPETFGFLSLYGLPHLALARAGLLGGILVYLEGLGAGWEWRRSLWLGLAWLGVALAQPLTALLLGGVLGLHLLVCMVALWRKGGHWGELVWGGWLRQVGLAATAFVLPGPLIATTTLAFSRDPFLQTWTAQNKILSPHPLQYLLAYGALLPLLALGMRKGRRPALWMLVAWVAALPVLVYAPFNLQRRLAEGIWPAMIALVLYGLGQLEAGRRRQWGERYLLATLLVGLVGTLILLAGGLQAAWLPAEPVFRPAAEVRAFLFLAETAEVNEVVLTSYATGNALPAWAPVRVVIGHGPESVNLERLRPEVEALLGGRMGSVEREAFLDEHEVKYILSGPAEHTLNAIEWKVKEVYKEDGYAIYRLE